VRPEPTLLEPVFTPRIWGARSLAPLFPHQSNLSEPIGEAWLTGHGCPVATGPFAGKSLGAAWREMPAEWRGTRLAQEPEFPLLVKFLFPNDKLSIQVHPDDAYAAAHDPGGRGKTEMWYAMAAKEGAELLLGLKPGTNPEALRAAIAGGTLEELLERWGVHPGEAFFVPARAPHGIGPGMTLCEIQQYCDVTYRLYDYGRVDASGKPRELHVEKALAVMNFGKTTGGRTTPVEVREGALQNTYLAACRYFAAEKWEFDAAVGARTGAAQFELLIVLDGAGRLEWNGGANKYERAHAWLLPATLGAYRLVPDRETGLLRAYVPDLAALRGELRRRGLDKAAISRVVFD